MWPVISQAVHRNPSVRPPVAAWRAGEVLASLCRPVNGRTPLSKTNARAFVWGVGGEKKARSNLVRQCGKKPLCARSAVSAGETI